MELGTDINMTTAHAAQAPRMPRPKMTLCRRQRVVRSVWRTAAAKKMTDDAEKRFQVSYNISRSTGDVQQRGEEDYMKAI